MSSASDPSMQLLLDEREIVAVALRYCRALDTNDWPALHEVFLADATATLGRAPTLHGIDAVIERITVALERLDDSQHLVGNHEVEVAGDTATHRCYLHAQHVRSVLDASPLYVVAGRYEDEFQRTEAGWRIRHRTLTTMWTQGNVDVVSF